MFGPILVDDSSNNPLLFFLQSIPLFTLHSRTNTDTATMASIAKSSTASSTRKGFDAGSKLDPPTNALVNSLLTDMYQVQMQKDCLHQPNCVVRSSAHPLSFCAHTHTRLQCHMPTGRVASTMTMPCLTCSFARIHSRASLQSLVAWRRCVFFRRSCERSIGVCVHTSLQARLCLLPATTRSAATWTTFPFLRSKSST